MKQTVSDVNNTIESISDPAFLLKLDNCSTNISVHSTVVDSLPAYGSVKHVTEISVHSIL